MRATMQTPTQRDLGPPAAAKVAWWLTVAIGAALVIAVLIATSLTGSGYWGGFVVGYFGAIPGILAWILAAGAGAVGFVQSLSRHSRRGLWMSMAPYVPVVVAVLLVRA
jgi:hypothetical protein